MSQQRKRKHATFNLVGWNFNKIEKYGKSINLTSGFGIDDNTLRGIRNNSEKINI